MAKRSTARSRHIVYGVHAVRALLEKRPAGILEASLLRGSKAGPLPQIARSLESLGVPIEYLSRADLDKLTESGTHQGVAVRTRGLVEAGIRELEDLVVDRGRSFRGLLLDTVQDPRNLGACLRTADAAGVDAVIVPRKRSAQLTPAARKTASGAAETVCLVRVPNIAAALHWLKEAGVWVVGADVDAPQSVYHARLEAPVVVAVGGEGSGLRRLTREHCDELVSIPMQGTVTSLNVSVAVGVLVFEVNRQILARRRSGDA